MNILTDILSLIKQDKYASSATDNDVIAIGVHEPPDMLGIAPQSLISLLKSSNSRTYKYLHRFVPM